MRSINQIAADTAHIYRKLSQKCKYPRIPCLIYFRYSFPDSFFYAMCMCHIDSFIVGNSGLFDCVVGSYDKITVYVYACFIFVEPCSFDNLYTMVWI